SYNFTTAQRNQLPFSPNRRRRGACRESGLLGSRLACPPSRHPCKSRGYNRDDPRSCACTTWTLKYPDHV
ncbi:hypothetical protein FRC00_008907, partial [Tulasnella sp. 408]